MPHDALKGRYGNAVTPIHLMDKKRRTIMYLVVAQRTRTRTVLPYGVQSWHGSRPAWGWIIDDNQRGYMIMIRARFVDGLDFRLA